ncbi:MAG: Gfo/Idh/MocA family oxidoreductase [Planctomycetes bacterium]|nr:Gfo/Idh/MocA family oxidoreductase [Planctomycetota bacterium]
MTAIQRNRVTRRSFLVRTVSAAGPLLLTEGLSSRTYAANEKLNIALVGVGGRGRWFVRIIPELLIPELRENVVAMCDVNERRAAESFQRLPNVPKFHDFRKMLDQMDRAIDAVIVATPDNTHAVITMAAMKRGKHV